MAAADVLHPSVLSFQTAVKTVERWVQEEPTDEEKLKFLRQAIKDLGEPGNEQVFEAAMKDLGIRAVRTDEAFDRVERTMKTFVKDHGDQFPGLKPFQEEWSGYTSTWRNEITTSRDFATQTSASYDDYTTQLRLVKNINNADDMKRLAADLKAFGAKNPIGIPVDFKDEFLKLKRDVEDFQIRFNKYLDEQDTRLNQRAQELKAAIDELEEVIRGLDKQIADATLGLEIAAWWGPVAAAIAGTALGILALKRKGKQDELDDLRAQLKQVEADQKALGEIKAQFAGLVPEFKILSENLGLFADTWNAFHNEAVDFATKFEQVETPASLPALYQARIDLALAVSVPLSKGLKDYARAIQS